MSPIVQTFSYQFKNLFTTVIAIIEYCADAAKSNSRINLSQSVRDVSVVSDTIQQCCFCCCIFVIFNIETVLLLPL